MGEKINNIHDKFVRESFSDVRRASAFIEHFLPRELVVTLDLSTLRLKKESYMTKELKEYFSDLVFEVSLKENLNGSVDIALLFEHKSSPDNNVLIQVGSYMFGHWFRCVTERKKLKVIIPVIYYQGKKKWELPDLSALFKTYPTSISDYVPKMKHVFISLQSIPESQIETMRDTMMAAAVIAQKWRINPVKLAGDFKRIFDLFPKEGYDWNFLEMIVVYALNVSDISEEALADSIKNIPPKLKDNIMTTYSRLLEKGEQIGIQKGEQIGIQKEKMEVVLNSFDHGVDISLISNITGLTKDEITQILKGRGKMK